MDGCCKFIAKMLEQITPTGAAGLKREAATQQLDYFSSLAERILDSAAREIKEQLQDMANGNPNIPALIDCQALKDKMMKLEQVTLKRLEELERRVQELEKNRTAAQPQILQNWNNIYGNPTSTINVAPITEVSEGGTATKEKKRTRHAAGAELVRVPEDDNDDDSDDVDYDYHAGAEAPEIRSPPKRRVQELEKNRTAAQLHIQPNWTIFGHGNRANNVYSGSITEASEGGTAAKDKKRSRVAAGAELVRLPDDDNDDVDFDSGAEAPAIRSPPKRAKTGVARTPPEEPEGDKSNMKGT